MKPTRIIASLTLTALAFLLLSTNARASLDHSTPPTGSHHVDAGNDIFVDFTSTVSGASASTFLVRGQHSGLHSGTYSGNGTNRLGFSTADTFRAGERVDVTLTTGISGLSSPEVFSYRTRTIRSAGSFDNDLLSAPYTGTWPNLVLPGQPNIGTSGYYYGSAAGDITGDGIPDFAMCSAFPAAVTAFKTPANLGEWDGFAGHLALQGSKKVITPSVSGILYGVSIGDIDGDGYGDVVMSMSGKNPQLARYNSATGGFFASVPFGLSTGSEHISLGDINGDGRLDAVASGQPNFYCVNDGQGGFSGAVTLNNSSFSNENALADLDNDGDLDIVFIHGSGGVAEQDVYYTNNAGSGFSGPFNLGNSLISLGVQLGDMNGDGNTDAVVATTTGVVQYLNNGAPGFAGATQIAATGLTAAAITTGDVDGDGDLDLLVGVGEAGGTGQSYLYYNDGSGTYTNSVPISDSSDGHWGPDMQLMDLDGDGDLDIFSGRVNGNCFYLLNGARMFDINANDWCYEHTGFDPALTSVTPATSASSISKSTNITAGFNASMKGLAADNFVVHGGLSGRTSGALSGNGSTAAGFNPSTDFLPGEVVEVTVKGLYSEDVVQDFVTSGVTHTTQQPLARGNVSRFRVAAQAGPLEFDQKTLNVLGATAATGALATGDIDGDGNLEVVFGISGARDQVVSFSASGAGSPVDVSTATADTRALALADVDGDGDLDLAVGVYNGQSVVYRYNAGSFGNPVNIGGSSDSVGALAFADMNADGHPDLVVGKAGALNALYLNDGSGAFNFSANFGLSGYDTLGLAIGDVDNDGDLDVAEANGGTYNHVWLSDGRGGFNGVRRIGSQAGQTSSVVMADFNADGWLDIACGETGAPDTVHLNDGAGWFASATNISATTSTMALNVGDFDGDGDLDLVAAHIASAAALYLNNGSGTFSAGGDFGPTSGSALAVADLDGDADLDIVIGRSGQQDTVRYNELLPTVAFSQAQYTVNENAGTSTITVQLSQAHSLPVSVNWAATAGTATGGSDFTAASGSLNFAAGQTSRTFSVAILDDTLDETDETVNLALSNVNGGVLGTSAASLSILDNDGAPTVRFATGAYSVSEGGASVSLTVELSNTSGLPVSVSYASSNGTATAGADYTAVSGQLSFAAGELTKTLAVSVSQDNIDESDETLVVTLTNPQNATTGALNTTTVTILDDDSAPVLNLSPTVMLVPESAGVLTFTVSLSNPSAVPVTVDYAAINGSANAGSDFAALAGTLTIAPGTTTSSITVQINDDSSNEPDESFTLLLSNPSAAVAGADFSASITIQQDPSDVISIGAAKGSGGGGGGGCAASDAGLPTLLLLLALFGLTVLRTRKA